MQKEDYKYESPSEGMIPMVHLKSEGSLLQTGHESRNDALDMCHELMDRTEQ